MSAAAATMLPTGDSAEAAPYPDYGGLDGLEPASCLILLVEDDRLNRRILSGLLRHEGWRVVEAAGGEEALARYAVDPPDLVLLAMTLPGMDGLATCRELRLRHREACAPIIFLTARDAAEDVVAGFAAGAADYVPKPWRDREVVARIHSHLHKRALAARQMLLVGQLSAANAAKDRFVGMVAHDLRSPLAAIRGFADFLGDTPLSAEQRELLEHIRGSSQALLGLVEELLDFAQIESGRLRLDLQRCNLADLLQERARLFAAEAARKSIRLQPAAVAGEPVAQVDPAKMGRVMDNLISNAVKFSPNGTQVTLASSAGTHECGFAVCDEGPGIPENERHLLFGEFARLSTRPTGGEKSTGLGLAIARRIVEAHHGTIAAENLPQRGCEFRVRLPRCP